VTDHPSDSQTAKVVSGRRPRILFVSEAVTLAHLARPIVLAQELDPACYEVVLASDPRYRALLPDLTIQFRAIRTISSERFLEALARGRPLFDAETLREYVREDLEVIEETSPDLVVGDLRLSLAISARVAGVPYLTITNVYWSPYARLRFPMPELPLTKWVGVPLAKALFGIVRPWAFAYHTRPLNRVRREYGLSHLGLDLRRIYTEADHTLYADIPEFVPMVGLPANHHFLGPILWSPSVEFPPWWDDVPQDHPVIYVTLGSSGRSDLLAVVLEALADLPVTVLASTAGRVRLSAIPSNARVAAFLPGENAAARARLVVCNGGSPTTQQALTVGTPVLGLVSNMDQHLNMGAVQRLRAGELLRAESATISSIRAAVDRMLVQMMYSEGASRLARSFSRCHAPTRFLAILSEVLTGSRLGLRAVDAPGGTEGV
jgi:UDP:flavonoid glycosyltransferase YjiC (YdhE family)